ncbi:DUF4281 domain-containing protein [Shimazuella sp. AN120528]|uniref:ABA4-like family protein n=1 Tax=Shimazuella soli TaxID=1892854 RepID=UPI001F0DB6C2|nr:DUF4281 domain-containing protein [Shimazuella soli]MCH5585763.1 DUF4281 domain-containing protein [Shimazuella soli]
MTNTLFLLANGAVYFWLIMMFLPKWKITKFLVEKKIVLVYIALLYTIGVITFIAQNGLGFVQDFRSAAGVIHLMSQNDMAIICWIHLLCFDQLVGHYIFTDNQKHRIIPLPIQSIFLFFTLMFGPFGFLCYTVVKMIRQKG